MNKYVDHIEKRAAGIESALDGVNSLAKGVAKSVGRASNSPAGEKAKESLSAAKNSPAGKTLGNMIIPGMSVGATGAYVNNKMTQGAEKRKQEQAEALRKMQPSATYPAISSMYPAQPSV